MILAIVITDQVEGILMKDLNIFVLYERASDAVFAASVKFHRKNRSFS